MKVLGINYLSESSVCLIEDGEIKFAISEERLNRKKNWYGNPFNSVEECLKVSKTSISKIDYICTHGKSSFSMKTSIPYQEYKNAIEEVEESKLNKKDKVFLINQIKFRQKKEKKAYLRNRKLILQIKKKYKKKLEIFDHHLCHAASAAYFSGWKKCVVLTIDGYGDSSSSKLFEFKNNKFTELRSSSILNSIGYFYGSITKYLGFKPQRHERKNSWLSCIWKPQ